MQEWILHHIAQPTIQGMAEEDTPFAGSSTVGLMMTARGPQVLEFNARFGDPETQAILMRLESDLVEAMEACVEGRLSDTELRWAPGASACVIASSGGYPGSYKTGFPIKGLEAAGRVPGVQVFHSGTAVKDGEIVTNGGRVLGVTAVGDGLGAGSGECLRGSRRDPVSKACTSGATLRTVPCDVPARVPFSAIQLILRALLLRRGSRMSRLSGLRLLETRAAQHRPALRGTEGDGCLLATCGALGARFSADARASICTLSLALLAALGIVFKLFIVKEKLLTGGEDKLVTAIYALKDSILKFHGRLPREGK